MIKNKSINPPFYSNMAKKERKQPGGFVRKNQSLFNKKSHNQSGNNNIENVLVLKL